MTAITQPSNIGGAIRRAVQSHPDRDALIAADIQLSYDKLWQVCRVFAVRMNDAGIGRGTRVHLLSRDAIVSVAVMAATSLLGARFEIFNGAVQPSECDDVILYSPDQAAPKVGRSILISPDWSPRFSQVGEEVEQGFAGYATASDPWWTLYTSGTTGTPKALVLTHQMAFDRSIAVRSDFQGARTRFTSLFPCNTRPFFVRAMAALVNGATIVDTFDSRFMAQEGVNLVAGAHKQVQDWAAANPDQTRFSTLQVSGAKVTADIAAKYLERFDVVEDVYGSGETNKSFVTRYTARKNGIDCVGVPQDSTVEIVDDDGGLCGVGEIGRVRISNGYMTDGYVDAPEATAKSFRDGWFYPGDLARWTTDGALDILGRVDHVLNLGGAKVDPLEIEATLTEVAGVRKAAVFADPAGAPASGIVALLELFPGHDADRTISIATDHCRSRLGPVRTPNSVLVVPEIPVTLDGTPIRRDCAKLFKSLFPKPSLNEKDKTC